MKVKKLPAEVFHPVEFIRDEMESRGWGNRHLEAMANMTESAVEKLLNREVSVTPLIALKLAQAFGTSATLWYRMQVTYDKGAAMTVEAASKETP